LKNNGKLDTLKVLSFVKVTKFILYMHQIYVSRKLSSGKGLIIQAIGNLSFKGGFKHFTVQDQKIINFSLICGSM